MNPDCYFCSPSSLRLAAQYGVRPSQVVDVRSQRGGTLVRCLCCKRHWISKAKWTRETEVKAESSEK